MRTNSGSALIVIMIISVTVFGLALTTSQYTDTFSDMTRFYRVERDLRSMADLGANNGINNLRNDEDLWEDVQSAAFEEYVDVHQQTENGYSVIVRAAYYDVGEHGTAPYSAMQLVHVVATASHQNYENERTVEYLFNILETEDIITPFTNGMFANDAYDFKGSTVAGYYNSKGDPITSIPTVLASNGTVNVQKPGNVSGNVQNEINSPMPEVSFTPEGPEVSGGPDISSDITLVGGATLEDMVSYQCRDVDDVNITVKGYVKLYVSGAWGLDKKGQIIYSTPAATRLIIVHEGDAGSMKFNGNNFINSASDPSRLIFMTGHTGNITLNGSAGFGAVFLAPQANISMNGTFDMYGAIVGESFDGAVLGNFTFQYDTDLAKLEIEVPVTSFADFKTLKYSTY